MFLNNVVRRRWSLAARLTAWYLISSFTLILLVTGVLYFELSSNLNAEDDDFLRDQTQAISESFFSAEGGGSVLKDKSERADSLSAKNKFLFRVLGSPSNYPIYETPGISDFLPNNLFPAIKASIDTSVKTVVSSDKTYRLMTTKIGPSGQNRKSVIIQIAMDRSQEEKLLSQYRDVLGAVLLVSLLLCGLAGYKIARRGIKPIEEIAGKIKVIESTTLNERLQVASLPSELLNLAGTFNEMLDRIEEAFSRISRFSDHIAHELRSPLNNLRVEVEVTLNKTRSEEEYRRVLESNLEEYGHLSRMIESLLFLARAESPSAAIQKKKVNVRKEIGVLLEFYEVAAIESGINLQMDVADDKFITVDPILFQRALGNLIENATKHTAKNGTVTIRLEDKGPSVQLSVMDSGCGIAPEHLPHVFERLYRVDEARTSKKGGSGLGLSIVKSIVELHRGTVDIKSELNTGTRVSLTFPADV